MTVAAAPATPQIKIKNEAGETRIYLNGVHVGRIQTWCPPTSEANKGVKRIGFVRMLDGRKYDLGGYRRDVIAWVRAGSWISDKPDPDTQETP